MRFALILSLSLLACGEGTDDATPAEPWGDDLTLKIRNGEVTTERPEVGRISGCTATLVAQDVAITAAHCIGYRTQTQIANYDNLRLTNGGETRSFTVNRRRSFSRDLGANDIAILGLADMVPADFAQAAPIASETPELGTSLTVFGFGCTQIGGRGDGRKRKATYEQGDSPAHLCPGDSGGPVFNDETGAVARINSGYRLDGRNTDIYGLVPGIHAEVLQQIEDWTQGEVPQEGEPLDPNLEICGRTADVFESWTCTPSRNYRHRCLPGGAPTWERCGNGCVSAEKGKHDTCRGDEPDNCGATYRAFAQWRCANDDYTLVRCNAGELELQACASGCDLAESGDDTCF